MLRAALLAVMLLITVCGPPTGDTNAWAATQDATPAACPDTSEAENQSVVQRYYDLVNAFDLDGLHDVYAPVIIQHAADVPDARGADETIANIAIFLEAFPDLHSEIDQWVTDGDLVAARVIQSGTQEFDFLGIPATGKHATWTVLGIFRIECGRIAEHWVEVDQISRLQQLGVVPEFIASPGATPAGEPATAVASPPADCPASSEEENAELIRRWYDDVWTQGDLTNLDAFVAPDHTHHRVLDRLTSGGEARKETIRQWREAFPDLTTTLDFLMTDGDRVVARWSATGTQEGTWQGIAPTGKTVTWTGNTIFRIACGRIAEEWSEAAGLSFFQQLGVIDWPRAPAPDATPPA